MEAEFKRWFDEHVRAFDYLLSECENIEFPVVGNDAKYELLRSLGFELLDRLVAVRALAVRPVEQATSATTLARSVFDIAVWLLMYSVPSQNNDVAKRRCDEAVLEYELTMLRFFRDAIEWVQRNNNASDLLKMLETRKTAEREFLDARFGSDAIERRLRDRSPTFFDRLKALYEAMPSTANKMTPDEFAIKAIGFYADLCQATHVARLSVEQQGRDRRVRTIVAGVWWANTFAACGWAFLALGQWRIHAKDPSHNLDIQKHNDAWEVLSTSMPPVPAAP